MLPPTEYINELNLHKFTIYDQNKNLLNKNLSTSGYFCVHSFRVT